MGIRITIRTRATLGECAVSGQHESARGRRAGDEFPAAYAFRSPRPDLSGIRRGLRGGWRFLRSAPTATRRAGHPGRRVSDMKRAGFAARLVLCLSLLLLGGKPLLAAEPVPEYQLKSAFIYNFATFIDWPGAGRKQLTLCVAVPQDSVGYFTQMAGKPVGDLTLAVRPLGQDDSAEGCSILFVADSESASFDDWLSEVGDENVLTIAESADWLKKGVVMSLLLQDNRVTFDVNLEAARGENLDINSRLLRLARKVYGLEATNEPATDKKPK